MRWAHSSSKQVKYWPLSPTRWGKTCCYRQPIKPVGSPLSGICKTVALCLIFIWQGAATACDIKPIDADSLQKSTALGLQLVERLEHYQPNVAIVARAGSDLRQYGLHYSHAGLIFRNHPKGKWVFTHLLNHCATAESDLFDEGAIAFFADAPFKYDALLVIPKADIQRELERLLHNRISEKLHEQKYSAIANPESDAYQNSNQWVLEMIAVAKSVYLPEDQRKNALFLASEQGYQPSWVKAGLFKRIGASLTRKNVRFDDHSEDNQISGKFPFVSVKSLVDYLLRNNDIIQHESLSLNQPINNLLPQARSAQTQVTSMARKQNQSTTVVKNQTTDNAKATGFWMP